MASAFYNKRSTMATVFFFRKHDVETRILLEESRERSSRLLCADLDDGTEKVKEWAGPYLDEDGAYPEIELYVNPSLTL
jgi:hypothetical protein